MLKDGFELKNDLQFAHCQDETDADQDVSESKDEEESSETGSDYSSPYWV